MDKNMTENREDDLIATNKEYEYTQASLKSRALALILDLIQAFALSAVIVNFLLFPNLNPDHFMLFKNEILNITTNTQISSSEILNTLSPSSLDIMGSITRIIFMTTWLYFTFFEMLKNGSTLGKQVFSIKIINTFTHQKPNTFQILSRSFIKVSSILFTFPIFLLINIGTKFLSKNKRFLHDIISSTDVIITTTEEVDKNQVK